MFSKDAVFYSAPVLNLNVSSKFLCDITLLASARRLLVVKYVLLTVLSMENCMAFFMSMLSRFEM